MVRDSGMPFALVSWLLGQDPQFAFAPHGNVENLLPRHRLSAGAVFDQLAVALPLLRAVYESVWAKTPEKREEEREKMAPIWHKLKTAVWWHTIYYKMNNII
jgi:hypothetical protein